jgi:hypothetical protein
MRTPIILCVATYFKGDAFLRECHRLGATVLLLTVRLACRSGVAARRDRRDSHHSAHCHRGRYSPGSLRQSRDAIRFARVAALDDFDVEMGAMLREFLQLPGFGRTVASRFRDKLAMRTTAKKLGLAVPEFTGVFNDDEVNAWTGRVPPPWVLKPRSSAASTGIKKIASAADLWPALHGAGDERPACLLEGFVAGEVFHVDSIVRNGKVVLAVPSKYGRPPMQIAHEGGIFITRRLPDKSPEAVALLAANRKLLIGFELHNGVSHTEFIMGKTGVTFLETSARVGGAYIVNVIEAATGVNLWHEWAKLELAGDGRRLQGAEALTPRRWHCVVPVASGEAGPVRVQRRGDRHEDTEGSSCRCDCPINRLRARRCVARFLRVTLQRRLLATMPAPERPVE